MFNPAMEAPKIAVRASSTLTAAYVASTVISIDRKNQVGFEVIYTKGDETSMSAKIEVSNDGGTTWVQQDAQATSGGTVSESLAVHQFTATGNYALVVNPVGAATIRISVLATGGTPTGTVAINAIPTWR
jgi:hypothetical protein